MFKIVDCLGVIAGKVTKIDEGKAYHVTIEYNAFEDGKSVKKQTTVSYWNNEATEDREATLYADKARNLKLTEGSNVMTLCKFMQGDDTQATGYRIGYNGVIRYNNAGKIVHTIMGQVTWAKETTNQNGEEILRLGVYLGKNQDGSFRNATITIPHKATERAKKFLIPDKESRLIAMFLCGDEFKATGTDGNEFSMYTAFGMELVSKTPRS